MDHIPVLKKEILKALNLKKDQVYLDCTAGRGGHIDLILNDSVKVIAIDKDPKNVKFLEDKYKDNKNVNIVCSDYKDLDNVLSFFNIKCVDAVVFDLGYSSIHVDQEQRGFSFKKDGPLDMRYNQEQDFSAKNIVNEYSFEDLSQILKEYGEEIFHKKIANEILKYRLDKKILRTRQLRELVLKAIPAKYRRNARIDPATKTFQAIRIEVNSELESLKLGLKKAIDVLNQGGRLCVISFHSLEDRIVKRTFNSYINPCTCPPKIPMCVCGKKQSLKWLEKGPIMAEDKEKEENKRARSAKLRIVEKV
jgi:16S rRNA (cytosine1402-N4)-methyltransferase